MKSILIAITISTFGFHSYAQNTWTQKTDFGGTARSSAVGFSIGSKGYIGTGYISGLNLLKDFWEYDPTTDTWSQKADVGGSARYAAVGFSINGKGYIGTGVDSNYNITNDFWEYDPSSNSWVQKANLPGPSRHTAVGFSIGDKGFIGTGSSMTLLNYYKDFWEYNPVTDSWQQKQDFPGFPRRAAVAFSINSRGYICGGIDSTGSEVSDFYEFDTSGNSWMQRISYPGSVSIYNGAGFSIGNSGFALQGNVIENDFYEYRQTDSSWIQRTDFAGTVRARAVGFSIGNKGFIGTGSDGSNLNDFWEYEPSPPDTAAYVSETNISDLYIFSTSNLLIITTNMIVLEGTIYSSRGQTIMKRKKSKKFDLTSLSPGVYFISIATEKGNIIKKFVKE